MPEQAWTHIIPQRHNPPMQSKAIPNTQLRAFREARGFSQAKLAEAVGCGQGDIAKLESGAKRTTVDWMVRLAPHLAVDPKDLMPPAPGDAPLLTLRGGEVAAGPRHQPTHPRDHRQLIPVRSAARGGEQEMFLHDGPIDWVPRPYSLLNVHDPYVLYMVGESMLPRFRPGQLLYVNPHRPITPGYGAVITKSNNAVTVKEFVRRTNRVLELLQYNPAEPIEIPLEEVLDVHTIVQIDEP